jgi:hypothetical protein
MSSLRISFVVWSRTTIQPPKSGAEMLNFDWLFSKSRRMMQEKNEKK